MSDLTARWNLEARRLVGRTITGCSYSADPDLGLTVLRIVLDDGTVLSPMADDEGNDAGCLFALESPDPDFHGLPRLS